MIESMNRVEIDLAALRSNCRALQEELREDVTRLLAVVKSDAYGHGMLPVARCLQDEGVHSFGVAEVHEGVLLRQAGISGDIIVFLGADEDCLAQVVRHNLQPVFFDSRQLAEISAFATAADARIGVHLKVDTGMGRLGILPDEVAGYLRQVEKASGVYLAGIMSHFPMADEPPVQPSVKQDALFKDIAAQSFHAGENRPLAHIANSAAMLRFPDMQMDMVRPGISLYGCNPLDSTLFCRAELAPVMSFKTKVIQVKDVPAGFPVSYGHTFTTSRPSRLAVLPVGYHNGYLRVMSNRSQVLIRGQRAPQRGRVCMNATVVDVTDIAGVEPGDEAVLMGRQGRDEISAGEVAGWMDTIHYEVLCLFGNSNRRVYIS